MFDAKDLFQDYLKEVAESSPRKYQEASSTTTPHLNEQPSPETREMNIRNHDTNIPSPERSEHTSSRIINLFSHLTKRTKLKHDDGNLPIEEVSPIDQQIKILSDDEEEGIEYENDENKTSLEVVPSPPTRFRDDNDDSDGDDDYYYTAEIKYESSSDPAGFSTGNATADKILSATDEQRKRRRSKLRKKRKKRKKVTAGIRPAAGYKGSFVSLLDTLPNEEDFEDLEMVEYKLDPTTVYIPEKNIHINDVGTDCLVIIFSFLNFRDLVTAGGVCILWFEYHKKNMLWEYPLRSVNHGSLSYITPKPLISEYKRRIRKYGTTKNSKKLRALRSLKKMKKKSAPNKYAELMDEELLEPSAPLRKHISPTTQYYRTYRRIQRDKVRMTRLQKKISKRKQLRQHYNRLFTTPQVICEIVYLTLYTPFFFASLFVSTVLYWFLKDGFLQESEWWTWAIATPAFVSTFGYLIAMGCAIAKETLRSFRRAQQYDATMTMLYTGNVWLPLSFITYFSKSYILPAMPYRAAFAPQWVCSFLFVITSFLFHYKFSFLRWKWKQKAIWAFLALLNILVSLVTAFCATEWDEPNGLIRDAPYSRFVFIPVWIFLIACLVFVPLYGCVMLPSYGCVRSIFIVLVGFFVIGPFIPFFLTLSLKLDGVIKNVTYAVVLGPLIIWELFWLVASLFYSVYCYRQYIANIYVLDDYV
mmetsp:Transcript_9549/g.14109  ORF Transcript_9549/g.14109 Transcript_9549/m.14109 type:complete len:700 (+) Transcript_9549:64-2163(+)